MQTSALSARALPVTRAQAPPPSPFQRPEDTVVFPAMNPLLLKSLEFDVEINGMAGGSSLHAPLQLTVGSKSGDLTYDLPLVGNQMKGTGTFDGKPLDETWTFSQMQLKVDGHYDGAEEHLVIAVDDKGVQHVTGTVGQYAVKEDITSWDKTATEGYVVDGTIGASKIHQEYEQNHAGQDGKWQTTMQGTASSASSHFATLHDRHQFDAQGQNGHTAWTATGAMIFVPDPNAPPPSDG
ncbi:MAG TPA: hypothetical protein VGO93_09065 [Candidatus Xenobia bacterium]